MSALTLSDLQADLISPVGIMRLDMPGYTARFWTGVGSLTVFGAEHTGSGEIIEVSELEDAIDVTRPRVSVTVSGFDVVLRDELMDYVVRGSSGWLWIGLVSPETRALIGDPELLFRGVIDTVVLTAGDGALSLDMEFVGGSERASGKGIRRFTPSDQEAIYSGDLFMQYSDDGSLRFPWGNEDAANPRRPAGNVTGYRGPGFGGGGGGWGGGGFNNRNL